MHGTALLRRAATVSAVAVAALVVLVPVSAGAHANHYTVTPLVSDNGVSGTSVDPNLVNAWGLAAGAMTPWWVADNATNVSTLYDGTGAAISLVVSVDTGPTGLVFNGSATDFMVSDGTNSGAARFIFATEDGTIRGWSPGVPPPPPSTQSEIAIDRSAQGAIYKGLAIADTSHGPRLYAADFHNGRVDVFDGSWKRIRREHAFVDRMLPHGYAPFGIQTIGSRIYVTYAKQDALREDEVAGNGRGFVDAYSLKGHLKARVARRGPLNAPWGLAWAPKSFGRFGGDLLVGNFGNGRINAYEKEHGRFELEGRLLMSPRHPVAIDGLWALEFGNGNAAGPVDSLFFTAGPEGETHGLFGRITAG